MSNRIRYLLNVRNVTVAATFAVSFGIPLLGNWIAFNYVFPRSTYGTAILLYSISAIAVLVAGLGLEYHILRLGLRAERHEDRRTLFAEVLRSLLIATPAATVGACIVVLLFKLHVFGLRLTLWTQLTVGFFIIFGVISRILSAALRVRGKLIASIVIDRMAREGGLLWGCLLSIYFVPRGQDLLLITLVSSVLLLAISCLWAIRILRKGTPELPTLDIAQIGSVASELPFRSARDLGAYSISELLFLRGDILILGALISVQQLAPYAFYSYLIGVISTGFIFLNFTYFPQYGLAFQQKRLMDLRRLTRRIGLLSGASAIVIVMFMLGAEMADQGLGFRLIKATLFSPVFLILAAGQMAAVFFGPSVPGLIVMRRSWVATNSYLLGTIVRALALPIGLSYGGFVGAAICSALITTSVKLIQYFGFRKYIRYHFELVLLEKSRWPNLFIVGAPKCGTTALYQLFQSSRDIYSPPLKEPHFFCDDFPGLKQVGSKAGYLANYESWSDEKYGCDSSVWYLYSSAAPKLIREQNPTAKIIVLVRDPIAMTSSFFDQARGMFMEDCDSFEKAWGLIGTRRRGNNLPAYCPEPSILDYKAIGSYAEQISRYYSVFGSENTMVIVFEELVANPARVLGKLQEYLGVDSLTEIELQQVNERRVYRSEGIRRLITSPSYGLIYLGIVIRPIARALGIRPAGVAQSLLTVRGSGAEFRPEFYAELEEAFLPTVRELEELLHIDLSQWWTWVAKYDPLRQAAS